MQHGHAGASSDMRALASTYTLQMTMDVAGGTPDPSPLVALVKSKVPGAVFVRSAAAEASMRLPMSATHLFADLLDELENGRSRVGLTSFSISMPSLVRGLGRFSSLPAYHESTACLYNRKKSLIAAA